VRGRRGAQWIGLSIVIFAMKLAAYAMSGVMALLAVNAAGLFRENMSILLGQAPPAEMMERLEAAARSVAGVLGTHGLRAEYIGPGVIHADIHIEVSPTLTVVEAHERAKRVDAVIEPALGNAICEVHVDPRP
jgi:divalent metal cation (Fe/Co/Zn/Cd) transporter